MAYLREGSQGPVRGAIALPLGVAIVLQLALAGQVSILGGTFNFLAAAVFALAPGLEPRRAVVLGFLCGLLFDLTSTVPVGLMALLLTVAAFALSSATQGHALGLTLDGARLSVVAALVVEIVYGVALLALGASSGILASLGHGLATGVLTAAASVGVLAIIPRGEARRGFSARGTGSSRLKGPR